MGLFNRKKEELVSVIIGNGVRYRFKIKPIVPQEIQDQHHPLVQGSGMMEYFDDPRVDFEDESDATIMTVRFMESKFELPIDDPKYSEFHQKYIELVTDQLEHGNMQCECIESVVLYDL